MNREAGKGSSPRPIEVDNSTFDNNWERTFKNKSIEDDLSEQLTSQNNMNEALQKHYG